MSFWSLRGTGHKVSFAQISEETLDLEIMATAKKKKNELRIVLPESGYSCVFYVDSFHIERSTEVTLIHSWFAPQPKRYLNRFSFCMANEAVSGSRDSFLKYAEEISEASVNSVRARDELPFDVDTCPVVDIFRLARRNTVGEIGLYAVATNIAAIVSKEAAPDSSIGAQPVALLKSRIGFQLGLIEELYASNER